MRLSGAVCLNGKAAARRVGLNCYRLIAVDVLWNCYYPWTEALTKRSQIHVINACHDWRRMGCLNDAFVNDMRYGIGGHVLHYKCIHVNYSYQSNAGIVVLYEPDTNVLYTTLTDVSIDVKLFKNIQGRKDIT